MEPRPHERGNRRDELVEAFVDALLQWSHVLTNVETSRLTRRTAAAPSDFNGATSSRTWKHVKESGPEVEAPILQWSHVLTNVETGCAWAF